MKFLKVLSFSLILASISANATMDANHSIFVLSQDVQSAEYFVQKAPIIACYGVEKGPELISLTKKYMVPSNVGCGGTFSDNINVLTCAEVVSTNESNDYLTFKNITLDISKCADKNNADFIKGVRKVVRMNFTTFSVKKINLKLIK